jgi:hypothetical protein
LATYFLVAQPVPKRLKAKLPAIKILVFMC